MRDPFRDDGLELGAAIEGAAAEALPGDLGEEPFDQIEPGAGCWRELRREVYVPGQPALYGRCLVGGIIVEDRMRMEVSRRLPVDCFEEGQELVSSMARATFADDGAAGDVERGEQRRGAVALVIVGRVPARPLFIAGLVGCYRGPGFGSGRSYG